MSRRLWYNAWVAHKEVLTYKQFANMSYRELHRKLKDMLGQAQRLSVWFNAAERLNLLPALQAMHDKVAQPGRRAEANPHTPTWEQECRSLGITPEQVRQWKRRTQADTDIRHLLGEEPNPPGKRVEDRNAQAANHLAQLCKLVLDDDDVHAEQLAAALAERYGF